MHLPRLAKPLSNLHTAQFYGLLLNGNETKICFPLQPEIKLFFFRNTNQDRHLEWKAQPHCRCKTGCCQTERSKGEVRWIRKAFYWLKISLFSITQISSFTKTDEHRWKKPSTKSKYENGGTTKKKIQSMYSYGLEEPGLNQTAETHLEPK